MSTPATPSGSKPTGDERKFVPVDENYVAPSFEDKLRLFWQKNSKVVSALLIVILLAILAKGGWEYLSAQREAEIRRTYAAATTPAQLKAFVAANPKHALAAVAEAKMADDAYSEGRYTDAISLYDQSIATLNNGPLASRVRLGSAVAKLLGGRAADGEAALKALANDAKEPKAFRSEALFHLASYAAANGKNDDVKTYADQLIQLDPSSVFAQRVMQMRAVSTAATPATATTPAAGAPAITLPSTGK